MKVRTRITLWASLAGLVSTVLLSVIVFLWFLETPYEFLDQELDIRAKTMADEMARVQAAEETHSIAILEVFAHLYWVRIYDSGGTLLFASTLAQQIDLPKHTGEQGYLIPTAIPLNYFYADEDDQPAGFWNRVFMVPVGGSVYQVHVARPVENLMGESIESALMIGLALLASTLILIGVSYVVAGKILQPIRRINKLTFDITAKTLENRIPLTGNSDEIDELIDSLNAMFDRLEFSFRRQKEFVANASHELKTPIALLRLSMEEILQDAHLPLPLQERLLTQEQALARLGRLVNSLLDLSRLELHDTVEQEQFSLEQLVQSVVEEFAVVLVEREIRLTCCFEGDHLFVGDEAKLRRVLINLLDNAVRYNHRGGEVRCLLGEDEAGKTIVTIANTGPMINEEDRTRIFDQFYRCEKSRASTLGGAGLGLTIAKRIVELHGGDITAQSGEDGWNVLHVVLPSDRLDSRAGAQYPYCGYR